MDIQPTEQKGQALSDDQELAKVLAGVNAEEPADDTTVAKPTALPVTSADGAMTDGTMPDPLAVATGTTQVAIQSPSEDSELGAPALTELPGLAAAPAVGNDLDSIKQEALGELRPLVDKLNVSPEEKFDTYLLLLRSTDDRELIAPAHDSAKSITDETRKAQALLDIIKEIDFLNQNQPPQA